MDITFTIKGIDGHIAVSPTRHSRLKPEVAWSLTFHWSLKDRDAEK